MFFWFVSTVLWPFIMLQMHLTKLHLFSLTLSHKNSKIESHFYQLYAIRKFKAENHSMSEDKQAQEKYVWTGATQA